MISISIYLKDNGRIIRTVTCLDDLLSLQFDNTIEDYVEGIYPGNNFYIANDQPVEIPASPNKYCVFNYDIRQWVDPRTNDTQWVVVRNQRDQLLAASDWTQLPDVTIETKSAWATYRQQLRDITNQPDPFNITWPTSP